MLYLVSCDSAVDLTKVFQDHMHNGNDMNRIDGLLIKSVSPTKTVFVRNGRTVCLFILFTQDETFLSKLNNISTTRQLSFTIHLSSYENDKTVSLYRIVGIEDNTVYQSMLREIYGIRFMMIDGIDAKCRSCNNGADECIEGNAIIWVETSSDMLLKLDFHHFSSLFEFNSCELIRRLQHVKMIAMYRSLQREIINSNDVVLNQLYER